MKILIIGCGITGSAINYFLKGFKTQNNLKVSIWDKSRGCGGRMSTKRFESNDGKFSVDLGAQYFSIQSNQWNQFSDLYDELLSLNLLRELDNSQIKNCPQYSLSTKHYIAPNGSNSIVKYLLNDQSTSTFFNRIVSGIEVKDSKCFVKYREGNQEEKESFDTVVFTCPVPQITQMDGFSTLVNDDKLLAELKAIEYSSRFALGLFYSRRPSWLDTSIYGLFPIIQYVPESTSPIVAYVALDTDKRCDTNSTATDNYSICVHSRAYPFGKQNIDKSLDEIQPVIIEELFKLFPQMKSELSHIICHKWRYSQVHRAYGSNDKYQALGSVILGGDAFAGKSGLHHCLDSAHEIAQFIMSSSSI